MKLLERANMVGVVFIGGVKKQLTQGWTWSAAAGVGLHQGLKYSGNIKNGVAGGVATLAVIAGMNGIYNVALQWGKIKEVTKED